MYTSIGLLQRHHAGRAEAAHHHRPHVARSRPFLATTSHAAVDRARRANSRAPSDRCASTSAGAACARAGGRSPVRRACCSSGCPRTPPIRTAWSGTARGPSHRAHGINLPLRQIHFGLRSSSAHGSLAGKGGGRRDQAPARSTLQSNERARARHQHRSPVPSRIPPARRRGTRSWRPLPRGHPRRAAGVSPASGRTPPRGRCPSRSVVAVASSSSRSVAVKPGSTVFTVTPSRRDLVGERAIEAGHRGPQAVGQHERRHRLLDGERRDADDASPTARPACRARARV